jgi:hypothetical protein
VARRAASSLSCRTWHSCRAIPRVSTGVQRMLLRHGFRNELSQARLARGPPEETSRVPTRQGNARRIESLSVGLLSHGRPGDRNAASGAPTRGIARSTSLPRRLRRTSGAPTQRRARHTPSRHSWSPGRKPPRWLGATRTKAERTCVREHRRAGATTPAEWISAGRCRTPRTGIARPVRCRSGK